MISDRILDEIFPVPDLDELKEEKIAELNKKGFTITNFRSGGIFYTILMIILQIYIEFIKLYRAVIQQMYVAHAGGKWLELRAGDYSKERKQSSRTEGKILLTGADGHDTVSIAKGTVFKTDKDINGEELRFFTTEDIVFMRGESNVEVPVSAEKEGSRYNISENRITNCTKYIEGIVAITNRAEWITREGSDTEDDEALRRRTLNSWNELATGTTAAKYKAAAESVCGVLYADVDQLHPRGQGTVDIIVTSTAGAASEELLGEVEKAVEEIKGAYDNLLVKSAATTYEDVGITAILPSLASDEGIDAKIRYAIEQYFKVGNNRDLNELILLDIYCAIRNEVPVLKNIKITEPADDVHLGKGNVILLGNMDVTVIREE